MEAFEISGETSSYDGRSFCPRCGSRLLDVADPGDKLVEIRLGSLDDAPFELRPDDEIWVKRRENWIPPVEEAEQHLERSHPDEAEARTWVAAEIARLRSMSYSELLAQPLDAPAHHVFTSRTGSSLMGESVVFRDNSEEGREGNPLVAIVSVDEPRPGVVTPIAQDSFIRRPDGSFVGE